MAGLVRAVKSRKRSITPSICESCINREVTISKAVIKDKAHYAKKD
jgi:hypothetical protein